MIIIISLILLVAIGIFLSYEKFEVAGTILIIFSGIFLAMCLVSLITNPIGIKAEVAKFQAAKASIERARENEVDIENTAIQHKIIECNQWLAEQQYYNSTIFSVWIPDEVDNLKPMR